MCGGVLRFEAFRGVECHPAGRSGFGGRLEHKDGLSDDRQTVDQAMDDVGLRLIEELGAIRAGLDLAVADPLDGAAETVLQGVPELDQVAHFAGVPRIPGVTRRHTIWAR